MLNLVKKHQEITKKAIDSLPETTPAERWFSRIATVILFIAVVYILNQKHISTV